MIYRKKQYLGTEEEKLSADIIYGENKRTQTEINASILDQIPVGTVTTTSGTANVNDSSNLPLKDIQVLGNATQDGTPTPSTPVPINVVTGDNTILLRGKNLFNKNATPNYTQSGVSKSINSNGEVVLTYTGTTSANKYQDYRIFYRKNLNGKVIRVKGIWEVSGSNKGRIILREDGVAASSSGVSGNTITYTITNNEPVTIAVSLYVNYSGTLAQGDTITFKEITVTIDDADMTYEEYQEQTVTLPLGDIELAKIGTYTDRIYKSSDKWYLEKQIAKLVLNGNETTWTADNSGTYAYLYTNYYDNVILGLGTGNTNVPISDKLVGKSTSGQENAIFISASSSKLRMWLNKSVFTGTGTQFKTWLSTNNIMVYAVAITPTTTEITDTALINALEAIYNVSTYKNTTNFSIEPTSPNATGDLQITYRKDLQTLTDQIATLEARVELLEQ